MKGILGSRRFFVIFAGLLLFSAVKAFAAATEHGDPSSHFALVLFEVIIILLAAKLGGDLFVRMGQPAVLGELVFGVIVGNLNLLGVDAFLAIKTDPSIRVLSELGVVLLLFQVGLESDLGHMAKVGASSFVVATIGVIAPMLLGWGVATAFHPEQGLYAHIFVGAALCATSVGITARVLRDMGKLQTTEARIILGAAVIDDVQGLIILAMVQGIITATNAGVALSVGSILMVMVKAVGFLAGAILLGRLAVPKIFSVASRFRSSDILLTTSLGICFALAYLASVLQLAPIVGAFAAGLLLDEAHWKDFTDRGEHSVDELVAPIAALLVPIFFVRMGANVDIVTLAKPEVLGFAGALTVAAIIGKQVCGLGVLQKGLDRISIGIGMIPRGEVGLIFAAIGSTLVLGGEKVITPSIYSAVVIMVVITTMVSPILLKWSFNQGKTVADAEQTSE